MYNAVLWLLKAWYVGGILHTVLAEQEPDRRFRLQLVLLNALHHKGLYMITVVKSLHASL